METVPPNPRCLQGHVVVAPPADSHLGTIHNKAFASREGGASTSATNAKRSFPTSSTQPVWKRRKRECRWSGNPGATWKPTRRRRRKEAAEMLRAGPPWRPESHPLADYHSTGHSVGRRATMEETSCAARDGSTSQTTPAADSQCPICLGDIRKAAYVAYCMHCFCFACIRRWASRTETCPVCRQPFERLLHSVRGDSDYKEYLVSLSPYQRRRMAMERARSHSPQHHYNLRRRPTNHQPSAGRSRPASTSRAQRQQGAAPGPSNATSQQAPAPGTSRQPTPPSAGERPPGPAPAPDTRNGTVQPRSNRLRRHRLSLRGL